MKRKSPLREVSGKMARGRTYRGLLEALGDNNVDRRDDNGAPGYYPPKRVTFWARVKVVVVAIARVIAIVCGIVGAWTIIEALAGWVD